MTCAGGRDRFREHLQYSRLSDLLIERVMAPKYVASSVALLMGGASAFMVPTPMLRSAVAPARSSPSAMRMSADEEPWFSEAVAVNLADVDELT